MNLFLHNLGNNITSRSFSIDRNEMTFNGNVTILNDKSVLCVFRIKSNKIKIEKRDFLRFIIEINPYELNTENIIEYIIKAYPEELI